MKSSGWRIKSIPLAIRISPSPSCIPLTIGFEKKRANQSMKPVMANSRSIMPIMIPAAIIVALVIFSG